MGTPKEATKGAFQTKGKVHKERRKITSAFKGKRREDTSHGRRRKRRRSIDKFESVRPLLGLLRHLIE